MAEHAYELTIIARGVHGEHKADIEGRLPADTPQQAVAKIVEAAMDKFGSGKFHDVEAAGR